MSEFRADLHCHSTHSDGSDSPERLILLARELKLTGLSITDHDTIGAYAQAVPAAELAGLPLLSGVEFSAVHRKEPVHVLGYAFSLKNPHIHQLCERHQQRRFERNACILANLRKMGCALTEEELYHEQTGTIGRPHIALLLMKKGYVANFKEAFQRFLGEGKPAYEPGERISVEETIACIHAARGKAILAHPHLLQRSTTIRDVLTMPFDGIEGYYAKMPHEHEKKWIEIGIKKGWLVTGGSDYHGTVKPHISLGSSWIGYDTFQLLYNHYRAQTST